jgi:type VI secretion system ImpM family protein
MSAHIFEPSDLPDFKSPQLPDFTNPPQPPFAKGGLDAESFSQGGLSPPPFEKSTPSFSFSPFEKSTPSFSFPSFEKSTPSFSSPPFEKGTPPSPPFEKGGSGGISGFYGKLPEVGDFVQRQLPAAFVQPWDRWLRESLVSSQAQLGDRWLEIYLVSPLWRFVLAAGVLNPTAWAGVLMPSVDRVGRYFPLTIATPLAGRSDCLIDVTAAAAWFAQVETVALLGLHTGCTLATFEAQVLALPPFPAVQPLSSVERRVEGSFWQSTTAAFSYPELPPPAQFHHLLRGG